MNKAFIGGNLVHDPELRMTNNGTPVCSFRVAAKDGKETEFINVVSWNKTAENVAQYMSKGRYVVVFGRIHTRKYERKDGGTNYVTEVIADEVEFGGKPKEVPNVSTEFDVFK